MLWKSSYSEDLYFCVVLLMSMCALGGADWGGEGEAENTPGWKLLVRLERSKTRCKGKFFVPIYDVWPDMTCCRAERAGSRLLRFGNLEADGEFEKEATTEKKGTSAEEEAAAEKETAKEASAEKTTKNKEEQVESEGRREETTAGTEEGARPGCVLHV